MTPPKKKDEPKADHLAESKGPIHVVVVDFPLVPVIATTATMSAGSDMPSSRRSELIWLPIGPHELLPRYVRLSTPRQQATSLQRLREG